MVLGVCFGILPKITKGGFVFGVGLILQTLLKISRRSELGGFGGISTPALWPTPPLGQWPERKEYKGQGVPRVRSMQGRFPLTGAGSRQAEGFWGRVSSKCKGPQWPFTSKHLGLFLSALYAEKKSRKYKQQHKAFGDTHPVPTLPPSLPLGVQPLKKGEKVDSCPRKISGRYGSKCKSGRQFARGHVGKCTG